jgi:site-specific DNA recombinase
MGALSNEAVTGLVWLRYVRISPKPRNGSAEDKEVLSLERQDGMCEAGERQIGGVLGRRFEDKGVSAFSEKPRPDYQNLLRAIRAGEGNAVSVAVTDRLDRDVVERQQFITLCRKMKVLFWCELGLVDLENYRMRKFLRDMASDAMGESEGKADRHAKQHAQRLVTEDNGLWFSVTPFGYRKTGKRTVEPDPKTEPIVQELYARVLAGATLHGLARELNARHITTSKGYPWEAGHLRKVLLSPRYAGKRSYHGEVVGDGWPALVSYADWRAVSARLTSHEAAGKPRSSAAKYWLSGIARCGECKQAMHTVKVKGTMQYHCRKCFRVGIGLERTDEVVQAWLLERLSRADARRVFLFNTEAPNYAEHEAAIVKAKEDLKSLVLLFTTAKAITAEQLAVGSAELQEQITKAERAIQPAPDLTALKKVLEDPYGLWPGTTLDERRTIIRTTYHITITRATPGANTFNEERVKMTRVKRA